MSVLVSYGIVTSVTVALARARKWWFFGRKLTVRWHVAAPSPYSRWTTEGAVENVGKVTPGLVRDSPGSD